MIDLIDGRAQSLRIEVPGADGAGSEFRLLVGGVAEWHQAKRQRAAGPWTVSALVAEDVLQAWQPALGRGERCVFVCTTGADELRELVSRAVSAVSWDEFDSEFLAAHSARASFDRLRRAWPGTSDAEIFDALPRIKIVSIGESELARWINDRLRALVTGAAPSVVAAVLAQLADDCVHQELAAADVWTHLATEGMVARNLNENAEIGLLAADSADAYLARLRPLYIGGRELDRPEAATAVAQLDEGRRVILAGAAGSGKSVIAGQIVAMVGRRKWPILVVSADRISDATTTVQLGAELGLPESPAVVLAALASNSDSLLVIDQLDAVSVTSGRHPERLGVISELLQEASSYPHLRVLLSCRQFDLDNDRALRAVAHDDAAVIVPVGGLTQPQIAQALTDARLPTDLSTHMARVLAVPLHLALYVELALAGVDDLEPVRTLTQLYDRYWNLKREACRAARNGADDWLSVIDRMVDRMTAREELSVPEALVDEFDPQVKAMASEGVLSVGQGRLAFFHETFFDYCFARRFLALGRTLRELLESGEQDLFRRSQVRQVLTYEREADVSAYLADLAWLVSSPDVRMHLKILVASHFDTVTNPTPQEWRLLRPIAEDGGSPLQVRVWQAARNNPDWFPVLDSDGTWEAAIHTGGGLADLAIWALSGSAGDHPDRVLEILAAAPAEVWIARRRGFLRFAEVHRSRALVDLLIEAISAGDFDDVGSDLAHMIRQLSTEQPTWGVAVLTALVTRAASDGDTSPFDPAHRRSGANRDLTEEIGALASAAPSDFVDGLLPILLNAMIVTERPVWRDTELVPDALWGLHVYGGHSSLSDDLYDAMGIALAELSATEPTRAAGDFAVLRTNPYESAAFLLAQGYAANPTAFADEAAEWLAATPGARLLGYSDAPSWVSRQLVEAISPHCSQDGLDRLIEALMYYAPPYERTYAGLRSRGYTELCLLSGLDPTRRTALVERRLAELRRKFNVDDVVPPRGITGGLVPPPIPEDRARRMNDCHWLRAMQRIGVSGGATLREGNFVGDAWSQAQVLESLTKEDPRRFARLLLNVPVGTPEAYVSAILRGLGDAWVDDVTILLEVCRHARELGGDDALRWLVRLIEKQAAGPLPDELIEMVAAVARSHPDPIRLAPGEFTDGSSVDGSVLNSTRGAAALAIGTVLAEDPTRLPLVESALRDLAMDARPEVRIALIAALTPLLDVDAELAIALFTVAASPLSGELLGSRYVEHFLHHAIQTGHYDGVAIQLQAMVVDSHDGARGAAARQLTLAAYYEPAVDSVVDTLLDSPHESTRAASVSVFADNVAYLPRRERSIAVLSEAFHDPSKSVRDAAERAFHRLGDSPLTEYEALIAAFADSQALTDGAAAALHSMEASRYPLPPSVLDVCERFVAAHQADIADISTGAAGDATYVVRLALRMHAMHSEPELRRRSLDLIDQLVVLRAYGVEADLDTVER